MTAPTGRRDRRFRLAAVPVLVIVLAALPLLLAPYPLSLAGRILAFALVVVSTDLLTGVTGLPSLAQVGYFGVGAYTSGLVAIHWSDNLVVQLVAGVVVAGLLAMVTGVVVVRTSGIVFLMVTLAVGELIHQVGNQSDFLGASNGLVGIPPGTLVPGGAQLTLTAYTYWWALVVFLLGMGAAVVVVKSPLGRSMRAVRESPSRLLALGQSTYVVKLLAFVLAGALAGAGGAAWTSQTQFISPGDLAFSVAAIALLSVVLGGAGTLWGPVVGAALVFLTRDWLASNFFSGHAGLMLGLLFVLAVFLLPNGVAGLRRTRRRAPEPDGVSA